MGFDLLQTRVEVLAQPLAWTCHLLSLNVLICEMSTGTGLNPESSWHTTPVAEEPVPTSGWQGLVPR